MDTATVPVALARLRRSESPIIEPVAKVGGAPVFIESAEWPVCPACGRTMEFIAQLPLQEPLLLSQRFAMAYVFQCAVGYMLDGEPEIGFCPGDPDLGGPPIAVLLQSPVGTPHLGRPTEPPPTSYPDHLISFTHAVELDLDLDTSQEDDWDLADEVHPGTKFGGVPVFIQDGGPMPCPVCGVMCRFVAQIDADLDQKGYPFGTLLRFGDVGRAYLYLCSAECSPQGYVFWWDCS